MAQKKETKVLGRIWSDRNSQVEVKIDITVLENHSAGFAELGPAVPLPGADPQERAPRPGRGRARQRCFQQRLSGNHSVLQPGGRTDCGASRSRAVTTEERGL